MWKIVTNDHFLNQDKIFPSAQPTVAQIIKNAEKYPEIKRIIVFGSSVTSSFSPMSDVDIYVEQNPDSRYLLAKGCLRGVDYWRDCDCDEVLRKEALKNGVEVFKR